MEKAVGPDHPYVGMSLNNLAALYYNQGRFAEAEPLYIHSINCRLEYLTVSIPLRLAY